MSQDSAKVVPLLDEEPAKRPAGATRDDEAAPDGSLLDARVSRAR